MKILFPHWFAFSDSWAFFCVVEYSLFLLGSLESERIESADERSFRVYCAAILP